MVGRLIVLVVLIAGPRHAFAQSVATSELVERITLDATHGIAPQPPRVADLYRRARPAEGSSFTGMWVCDVSVEGTDWDGRDPRGPVRHFMGRVELDAEIALPNRDDLVRFRGPDDTNRVTFAVAGVAIASGESVTIAVSDRDVLASDPIARFELRYEGSTPIRARAEHASIECRGIPATTLATNIDGAIEAADRARDELESSERPDPSLVGFRDPDANPAAAMMAIYDIARWTGLADRRFLDRRDALRAREAAYLADVASMVRDLATRGPSVGTASPLADSGLTVTVDQFDCAVEDVLELHSELGLDAPMDCALRLRIVNPGSPTTFSWAMHLVDDLGATVPATRFATVDGTGIHRTRSIRLPNGETRLVIASPSRHAILLRLSHRRAVAWYPLVAPGSAETTPRERIDVRGRPARDRSNPNDPADEAR